MFNVTLCVAETRVTDVNGAVTSGVVVPAGVGVIVCVAVGVRVGVGVAVDVGVLVTVAVGVGVWLYHRWKEKRQPS